MSEGEIERSDVNLGRELFTSIFTLTQGQRWLENKGAEIHEILSLCNSDNESEVVVDLLSRFHFTSASEHFAKVDLLAKQIAEGWECNPQKTLIVALERGQCADSSSRIVQDLKAPFAYLEGWKTPNFISKLGDAVALADDETTIVVVDDFVGSGGSVESKVAWLRKELKAAGKNPVIGVAVVSAMEKSKEVVEAEADEFFALEWLQRGISDHYQGADLKTATAAMEELEKQLSSRNGRKKLKDYNFGWKRTEAIFYTEGSNPPNNNFPIFWWPMLKPKRKRNPILRRI